MTQFMGTHHNKLDAKGRVSIPASFRTALRDVMPDAANAAAANTGTGNAALVLRPSHKHRCVEGWKPADFHNLAPAVQSLGMFSEDQDDLVFALYADAAELAPDKEGRVVLPDALTAHAGLGEAVVFVGLGNHFQIWEPLALAARRADVLERARVRGVTLPGRPA